MTNARPEEIARKENVSSTSRGKKIGYSKENKDQQDQKRIHFTLWNRCEDELVVIPNPLRACSLHFLDD